MGLTEAINQRKWSSLGGQPPIGWRRGKDKILAADWTMMDDLAGRFTYILTRDWTRPLRGNDGRVTHRDVRHGETDTWREESWSGEEEKWRSGVKRMHKKENWRGNVVKARGGEGGREIWDVEEEERSRSKGRRRKKKRISEGGGTG